MFAVKPTQDDVENFVLLLAGRGWVHSRILRQELNVSRRHVCALAESSEGRVLSGNQGYRLTAEATKEELEKCVNKQLAQARQTQKRMRLTEDVWLAAEPTATTAF